MTRTILPEQNYNTSPPHEKRPARLRPITTIHPSEMVKVALRGPASNRTNGYVGTVVAVDGVALRLALTHARFDWYWGRAGGDVVLPWTTVERVDVQSVE